MEKIVIMNMSIDELTTIIDKCVTKAINDNNIRVQREIPIVANVRGVQGLADALGCSIAKAFQLKKSGKIRYFQDGKMLMFDMNQVYEDLQGINYNKRGRKPKQ